VPGVHEDVRATCEETRKLREDIEYTIPPEVRKRLETFVHAAALKYPEKVREYRDQVERDRREKVAELVRNATAGNLSSAVALLLESHCAASRSAGIFDALRVTGNLQAGDPPEGIRSHVIALMQTLPPARNSSWRSAPLAVRGARQAVPSPKRRTLHDMSLKRVLRQARRSLVSMCGKRLQ